MSLCSAAGRLNEKSHLRLLCEKWKKQELQPADAKREKKKDDVTQHATFSAGQYNACYFLILFFKAEIELYPLCFLIMILV